MQARLIQVNFRSWLLRKNYIHLREAARTLQHHWREKRYGHQTGHGHGQAQTQDQGLGRKGGAGSAEAMGGDGSGRGQVGATAAAQATASPTTAHSHFQQFQQHGQHSQAQDPGRLERESLAAATLQAATRRMIQRRQLLSQVHKQAALVIQRRFMAKILGRNSAVVGVGDSMDDS